MRAFLERANLRFGSSGDNYPTTLEVLVNNTGKKPYLLDQSHLIKYNFPKRAFDIAFSLCVILFIFLWLYPLVALLIKLTSRGPALFVQKRVGLEGVIFNCYKFRTMKVSSVKDMYTPTDGKDPRVTAIGHFLRASSLDELPQFFNVLKGDMSIVGPRPHPCAFHKTYAMFVDRIDNRLLVKPGITGLAQIRGYRGDVKDFKENMHRTRTRVALDLRYIKDWSFKTDIWIVYTTFMQMAKLSSYKQK